MRGVSRARLSGVEGPAERSRGLSRGVRLRAGGSSRGFSRREIDPEYNLLVFGVHHSEIDYSRGDMPRSRYGVGARNWRRDDDMRAQIPGRSTVGSSGSKSMGTAFGFVDVVVVLSQRIEHLLFAAQH